MDKKSYVTDKAFDAMLEASASDMENNVVESLLEGYDGKNHEFSEKHKKDMESLFRRQRQNHFYNSLKTYGKRLALIFILVIAISTITVASVSAWRIKIMNFILERTQEDTNIIIDKDELTFYENNELSLNYVPEGFVLEKSESKNNFIYYEFVRENDFFDFHTMDIKNSLSIDTEEANVKKISINNMEAVYSENNNVNILVWHDDEIMYILTGNISENELVKIAENINIKK